MFTAAAILSALLAAMFAAAGVPKVIGVAQQRTAAVHLGYSYPVYRTIGMLEIAAAAGLLLGLAVAPLGVAAAVGLVVLMVGASISHARVNDAAVMVAAPLAFGAVAAAAVVLRLLTA